MTLRIVSVVIAAILLLFVAGSIYPIARDIMKYRGYIEGNFIYHQITLTRSFVSKEYCLTCTDSKNKQLDHCSDLTKLYQSMPVENCLDHGECPPERKACISDTACCASSSCRSANRTIPGLNDPPYQCTWYCDLVYDHPICEVDTWIDYKASITLVYRNKFLGRDVLIHEERHFSQQHDYDQFYQDHLGREETRYYSKDDPNDVRTEHVFSDGEIILMTFVFVSFLISTFLLIFPEAICRCRWTPLCRRS